jgi:hypothetical protein
LSDSYVDGGSHHREFDLLVATHVVQVLANLGINTIGVGDLLENQDLRSRDLAALGLGSLDWIDLAARLESDTGVELPDHVLLEPEHRCVGRWAEALSTGRVAYPATRKHEAHVGPEGNVPKVEPKVVEPSGEVGE